MKKFFGFLQILPGLALLCFSVFSCKTAKVASEFNVKPMSAERIIKKVEGNAFEYKSFSIKRISCQYENGENSTAFRASLKTLKGQALLVSFNKLNIPVGRVMLTPDSVKYVNFLDKNYFLGDYGFLKNLFNADISFEDIQAILENNFFSEILGKQNSRDYTSSVNSGKYVLQSVKNRKFFKIGSANGSRTFLSGGDGAQIVQTVIVSPDNFNIEKISIEDKTNSQQLEFNFGDYTSLEGKDYPSSVNIKFISGQKHISMKLRFGGFSTETVDSMSFNIPSKYSQIVLN